MAIPDLTPTDLAKNLIAIAIVAAWLFLTIQGEPVNTELNLAFIAVLSLYGISTAKPVVKAMLNIPDKPPNPNTGK